MEQKLRFMLVLGLLAILKKILGRLCTSLQRAVFSCFRGKKVAHNYLSSILQNQEIDFKVHERFWHNFRRINHVLFWFLTNVLSRTSPIKLFKSAKTLYRQTRLKNKAGSSHKEFIGLKFLFESKISEKNPKINEKHWCFLRIKPHELTKTKSRVLATSPQH